MQNPLELAWHGLVLLMLLVFSVFFVGMRAQEQGRKIDALELSIDLLEKQIEANQSYVSLVDDLHTQIGDYERNFALIDTLAARRVAWSPRVKGISEAFDAVGGIWLERFSTAAGNIDVNSDWGDRSLPALTRLYLQGKTAARRHVSEVSERIGDGHIANVGRTKIRGKTVFEFNLTAPVTVTSQRP